MAKKIILFGDSLLAGYTNGHPTDRVTNALINNFPKYNITNESIPGLTTEEAADFLPKRILNQHYDLVTLGLGTNDDSVYNGLNAGRYAYNLNTLVKKLNPHKVILMGPSYTNWKIDPNQSWPRTLQFTLIAQQCSFIHHLPFLNLNKKMMETGHPNELLQDDGVHLNQAGIELLTNNLTSLIKQKIAE
ncbi:SGNH/GDSL hydrolase family protein [Lactobacillus sp. PV034]|uniref:SGNH/GDSL hydrolase family protein n=1 Tax=Lactobacillus sp. PV034 TaxID=2594495 RepID=UPI00223F8D33|nr:GDSL-type esterase/lipase family protein [Lactobacillus sp. PV034]QNQ81303.1 SGNH/GDSL hydrolase family protein [Lactobacillus sp. PV034]